MQSKETERSDSCTFDESLGTAFERTAGTFPDNLALSSDVWQPTYRELNATANRLANRLAAGGNVGDRIAILMEHDTPAIAVNLAIVKAGRIVVVLFPGDPVPRLEMLMTDAEPSVLVTDAENQVLARRIAGEGCQVVTFDLSTAQGSTDNPSLSIGPEETVALVYTSGATGRPKGVMYTHRQFRRNAAIHTEAMQYTDADRIPLLSIMATGQGANCVWYTLLNGATLCPFAVKKQGITGLADWIVDRGLTVYLSSASVYRALIASLDQRFVFPGVRAVRLASETATADDFRSFRGHFPAADYLVHTLASSEAGNIAWSRWLRDAGVAKGILPVGHISADIDVSLVGEDGAPVPAGETGEIVVRSRYVAAGYWRDAALTAERFSEDLDGHGTRRVRTGDMARFNQAGDLEFRGRKDDRIKIRGNRIELADIERALAKLPGVERAAAVAVPRGPYEPMLVAFVVLARNATWSETRLRHAVAANLPLHMVPSRFVFVDALPFTAGGKIDRAALRARPLPGRDDGSGEGPQSETEALIADVWAEALNLPLVARDDDFFSLGGDSLKGAVVAAQIHSAFAVDVDLAEIADHATVAALAALVDQRRRDRVADFPPLVPVPRSGRLPLSLAQERVWNIAQDRVVDAAHYLVSISGSLDRDILKDCLSYLVARHESLRTTIDVFDGTTAQTIHAEAPLHFVFMDFSTEADPERRAASYIAAEAAKPVDPTALPTSRHFLIKMKDNEHRLLRLVQPAFQDAWSRTVLTNELAVLYEAKLNGIEPPIPKHMPLQYADFAVWQRQVMRVDAPLYRHMLTWWKEVFSRRRRPVRLPFRRSRRLTGVDPALGVIDWQPDPDASQSLDRIARAARATHFIVRLSLFVALVADLTGRPTVVLGTVFGNRRHVATRNIVGHFANLTPLVFFYDRRQPFRSWIEVVRNRLFETERYADLPYEELYDRLRAAGLKPPGARILFSLSADNSEQRFGGLTVRRLPNPMWKMPWGIQVFVDERNPENCRVEFNANLYDRKGMQAMVDRYVRLLEIAAWRSDLTIGRLVAMSSENPLRRAIVKYASGFTNSSGTRSRPDCR